MFVFKPKFAILNGINSDMIFYVTIIASFVLLTVYFQIADKFNIIDKPNSRSSHTQLTIRGAGVVFPVMGIIGFLATPRYSPTDHSGTLDSGFLGNYGFLGGLLIIAIVSFWDDVRPLPPKIRMLVQAVAVAMMVIPLGAEWWIVALAMVLIIGTINAYNFMDGINGITALYSLVAVGTALVTLKLGYKLVLGEPIWLALGASLLAFSFYNVRKKARCFVGDVGAVSLAFILAYWIYGLVVSEGNLVYILFLGIYGLDSVATIAIRLYKKEDIFEAHRSHYYQYLANEKGWPHVGVALLYAGLQAVLNGVILWDAGMGVVVYGLVVVVYTRLRLPLVV
jgi:UDP-N-acetylmuramyl pentapeptide phosphotransferase/UDP-N-acetylglucosamine-1-phosphate transferase